MKVQESLNARGTTFHVGRDAKYYERRKYLEGLVRGIFLEKGGQPKLAVPYYMVIGECPWLATWFEDGDYVKIPINEFDLNAISFTYGDTFPTFSPHVTDDLEYRRQVYTYEEILRIIEEYGMPQDFWEEPVFAQPAYVEAQTHTSFITMKNLASHLDKGWLMYGLYVDNQLMGYVSLSDEGDGASDIWKGRRNPTASPQPPYIPSTNSV